MSMNYTDFVSRVVQGLGGLQTDMDLITFIPAVIDGGEQRCYRDLDLLNTVVRQTGTLTANARTFNLPSGGGRFVITESMSVFTPVSTTTNRVQLVPVTREWMDNIWGNEAAPSTPSIPAYYAMITDQQIIVGPPPDAGYTIEVTGTIRPTPLSAANPTTYLSLYLPDLFLAEALIFGYDYLVSRGITPATNPQAAPNWAAAYTALFQSANTEENRKRYAAQAWTPKQPAPLATPARV